jgi:4-cresol dehydrogenase (hydroxylating)
MKHASATQPPVSPTAHERALARWRRDLEAGSVITEPALLAEYEHNVSALHRRIGAVICPESTAAVQTALTIATAEGVPVYPISGGRNWGLGSRLPVRSGSVVLDLSRMTEIRSIDLEHGYAIVEPGVSQGHLAARLAELDANWIIDVTGAPRSTSVVGNVMDRGVGYLGRRADALLGFEVVLATGRVVRTGMWRFEASEVAHLLGDGIGPDVGSLFPQSNLGVVTAAIMALRPRPQRAMAFVCRLHDSSGLAPLISALRGLREREAFTSIVHVANTARSDGIMLPALGAELPPGGPTARMVAAGRYAPDTDQPAWTAVGALGADGAHARARLREIRRALRGIATVRVVSDRRLRLMRAAGKLLPAAQPAARLADALAPILGLVRGVPTDVVIPSMIFPLGGPVSPVRDPDVTACGWLFCLQALPFTSEAALTVERIVTEVARRHGFIPHITLNGITPKVLEAVVNICFDRRDAERVAAAHACDEALHDAFASAGFAPYRLGVQHMDRLVHGDDPYWKAIHEIKQALDPAGVIAPGRYGP